MIEFDITALQNSINVLPELDKIRQQSLNHKTDIGFEYLATQVQAGNILISEAATEYHISGNKFIDMMHRYGYIVPLYVVRGHEVVIDERINYITTNKLIPQLVGTLNEVYFATGAGISAHGNYLTLSMTIFTPDIVTSDFFYKQNDAEFEKKIVWSSKEESGGYKDDFEHHLFPTGDYNLASKLAKYMERRWQLSTFEWKEYEKRMRL